MHDYLGPVHTAANAIPAVDGTDLGDLLEDLAGIHAAIDLARDSARLAATSRLTLDQTQTLIAAIAGGSDGTNLINLFGQTIARITNPDTNPALRQLPLEQQKLVQLHGETTAFALNHDQLAQFASDTSAAITG
jgi:hypothetical protein